MPSTLAPGKRKSSAPNGGGSFDSVKADSSFFFFGLPQNVESISTCEAGAGEKTSETVIQKITARAVRT